MSAAESKPAPEASSAAAPAPAGGMKKGPWTAAEDAVLVEYVKKHGEGNWNAVQRNTGLSRCGKSCRLRWANHLRPNLKKGSFSPDEERLILELHSKMGNKWARMAAQLPGRTDNEIKNYWNTRIKRRQRAGLPLYPPEVQRLSAFRHRPPPPFPEQRPPQFSGDLSLFEHADFGPLPSSAGLAFGQPQPVLFQPPHMAFAGVPSPAPVFPFSSLGNYDLDPPPPPPPPPSLRAQQSFSMKMELPSSQLFPEMHSVNSGGDLLDALLRERDDRHQHHHHHLNFAVPEPLQERIGEERSPSLFLHSGGAWHGDVKIKIERDQDIAIDDDLSALLGAIPAAAMPSAGESNGQSAITDAGLEMQQATSSLSLAGDEPFGWSIMHRPPLV